MKKVDEKGESKVLIGFEEEKSENSASKVLEGCKVNNG